MKINIKSLLQKTTLRTRLLIPILALIILSTVTVGATSYVKAKDLTMTSIEDRLYRETQLMGYIAENLNFTYAGDEQNYIQELNFNIRSQQNQLAEDGIVSEYFYITENEAIPFPLSIEALPDIPKTLINKITEAQNGQFHTMIAGENLSSQWI